MFRLPPNFISISKEFLAAFKNPYTYDFRRNYYMFYGFLWGLPVIVFSLAIDFSLEGHTFSLTGLVAAFRNHLFHWFALAQPLVVMVIFGAMGTVQNEKDKGLKYLIEVLEEAVKEKTKELLQSYTETVAALADAIEAKDPYTRGHCHRVKTIALALAREVGGFTAADLRDLEFASILHDIGKISVPLEILRKPGPLTADEYGIVKKHSAEGARILQTISNFDRVRSLILLHHERPDGKGYPTGIRNHDVLSGILSLADVFDAMTLDRPYQKGLPHREALVKIQAVAGRQFQNPLVAILEKLVADGRIERDTAGAPPAVPRSVKAAPIAGTILLVLLAAGAPGCEQRAPRPEPSRAGTTPGGNSRVESIQFVTYGGAPAYSAALNRIAFQRFDPAIIGAPNLAGVNDRTGTFELWTAAPDGTDERCLTSRDVPGGPRLNQHKGAATWHPSGQWLVVAVEMPARAAPHAKAHAGTGAYVDLWAVSPDGATWRQLTRYANAATASRFPDQPVGALIPRFSRRGDRLAWAEMIGYDAAHPFGIWRLVLADFLADGDGPRLANLVRSEPGGPRTTFYEPWSFSPDDSLLAIASDHGAIHPGYMDVQLWNPAAGTLVNLTRTDREYEEQAIFSPDGKWLAYMSTAGQSPRYNPSRDFWGTFRTDIWLMTADGMGAERLTWFNDPAHAEYLPDAVNRAIPVSWSPDGRALYINVDRNRGERELHESKRIYRINLRAAPLAE